MATPADADSYSDALRAAVLRTLDGRMHVDAGHLRKIKELLSPERERTEWLDIIRAALGDTPASISASHALANE